LNPNESFYITANGVTVITHSRDNVLEWIDFILDHGMVPVIEKVTIP